MAGATVRCDGSVSGCGVSWQSVADQALRSGAERLAKVSDERKSGRMSSGLWHIDP